LDRIAYNTAKLAYELEKDPLVEKVNYPGLASNPYYPLAQKYFRNGFGGVLNFEIKGGREAAIKFIDALQLISHLANVGDSKSLAIHPASTTHEQLSPEEQLLAGVKPGQIRISVGIEHFDDIYSDVQQALKASAL
jgi:O-acetylhomoserine (thiol)-lyase